MVPCLANALQMVTMLAAGTFDCPHCRCSFERLIGTFIMALALIIPFFKMRQFRSQHLWLNLAELPHYASSNVALAPGSTQHPALVHSKTTLRCRGPPEMQPGSSGDLSPDRTASTLARSGSPDHFRMNSFLLLSV